LSIVYESSQTLCLHVPKTIIPDTLDGLRTSLRQLVCVCIESCAPKAVNTFVRPFYRAVVDEIRKTKISSLDVHGGTRQPATIFDEPIRSWLFCTG
ncbi:hypothetical protein ACLOJK_024805, partial [Asimina triloba]